MIDRTFLLLLTIFQLRDCRKICLRQLSLI